MLVSVKLRDDSYLTRDHVIAIREYEVERRIVLTRSTPTAKGSAFVHTETIEGVSHYTAVNIFR